MHDAIAYDKVIFYVSRSCSCWMMLELKTYGYSVVLVSLLLLVTYFILLVPPFANLKCHNVNFQTHPHPIQRRYIMFRLHVDTVQKDVCDQRREHLLVAMVYFRTALPDGRAFHASFPFHDGSRDRVVRRSHKGIILACSIILNQCSLSNCGDCIHDNYQCLKLCMGQLL